MSMSRAVRRQLCTLDLVFSVMDAIGGFYTAHDAPMPQDVAALVDDVLRGTRLCMRILVPTGTMYVTRKQDRAYHRALEGMKAEILDAYKGEEIPTREFLNAVLLLVEDTAAQMPPSPAQRNAAWHDLARAVVALYQAYDPDFSAMADMERGGHVGESMAQHMGG
ncbi:MAG: hypothetical protein AB7E47_03115 [Desulfovibrionaceae bacterium]